MRQLIWRHPDWTSAEAPRLPGSPAVLVHRLPVRMRFAAIAVLCSLTGGLGTAMIVANLPVIQGHLALTPVEGQWLTGAYVMVNCWSNMLLVKFRMQYGIHLFVLLSLSAYAALALLHLGVESYETALVVRAASGLVATPLLTLGFLYMIQAVGQDNIIRGAIIGLTLTQLASPLAYVISPWLIDLARPGLQYMFEAGMALCALAAVAAFPLPYSQREKVFEKADAVTLLLFVPALALLVAVLTEGRLQWWTDKPWLGLALCGAVILLTAGIAFEYCRTTPLLDVRWLASSAMLRFMLGALLIRVISAEQTVGVIGFLRATGMGSDQLAPLFAIVLAAMLVALAVVGTFANPKTAVPLLVLAVAIMLVGAMLDQDATPQDRPHDFYVSQALVGFASALFVGPLFITGFVKLMKDGTAYFLNLIVAFGFSQSVGLVLGGAILNTFQIFREHDHSAAINAAVDPTSPVVQQRLMLQDQLNGRVLSDPALRMAEGVAQLGQTATLNATTQSYNDIFLLTAILALSFIIWTLAGAAKQALAAQRNGAS